MCDSNISFKWGYRQTYNNTMARKHTSFSQSTGGGGGYVTECSHARSSSCLYSAYMKEKLSYSCSTSPENSKRLKGGAAKTRRVEGE